VRLVANKVAPVQVFLWALQFFPVIIIPPVLNTQSFIYHQRYVISPSDSIINLNLKITGFKMQFKTTQSKSSGVCDLSLTH
jgi:hypothetical protein